MAGPPSARLTHLAIPVADLAATVAWYEEFTHLEVVHQRRDADGAVVWLGDPGRRDDPFVIVAAQLDDRPEPGATVAGFAHFGVEVPERADVDEIARRGRAGGCLTWDAQDLGPPVGYVCALSDPDGNIIEFSHDQGVYEAVAQARP